MLNWATPPERANRLSLCPKAFCLTLGKQQRLWVFGWVRNYSLTCSYLPKLLSLEARVLCDQIYWHFGIGRRELEKAGAGRKHRLGMVTLGLLL